MKCLSIARWVWQLPQHLLGIAIISLYDAEYDSSRDVWISKEANFGVSLGEYRVIGIHYDRDDVLKHEYGHTKQSRLLGPLYLLIIGLPSAVGNLVHRKIKFDYYKQPWERWADVLGGVNRV